MAHTLLSGVTAANAEARYQAFYPACAEGGLNADLAMAEIGALYRSTDSPVVQSYCLLYFGAVVDSKLLDAGRLQEVSRFLITLLAALSDFRVKDSDGRYVHFISHAIYLAQSIHDAGGEIGWECLLETYLRAHDAFGWNEDIVLAECLLDITPKAEISRLLSRLKTGASEGPKASNKRGLWLAMKVLNEQNPRVSPAVFDALTAELVAAVA